MFSGKRSGVKWQIWQIQQEEKAKSGIPRPWSKSCKCKLIYEHGRLSLITGRNEVVAKVMFLLVSVILLTGRVSGRENPPSREMTPLARRPPGRETPPSREMTPLARRPPSRETPLAGRPHPAGTTPRQGQPPGKEPPPGRETPQQGDPPARRPPWQGDPLARRPPPARETPPRHTVNERPVRILLEYILV